MRRAAFGVRVDPRSTPGSQWQRSHAFTAEALARARAPGFDGRTTRAHLWRRLHRSCRARDASHTRASTSTRPLREIAGRGDERIRLAVIARARDGEPWQANRRDRSRWNERRERGRGVLGGAARAHGESSRAEGGRHARAGRAVER